MIRVTVFTVKGEPTFDVPLNTTNAQLRQMVEDRWGWVGIGVRHSFFGVLV